jgi:hypothetical protein
MLFEQKQLCRQAENDVGVGQQQKDESSDFTMYYRTVNFGHRWDKHFGVLISEGPYKQPRITKNVFGRDMLWGVPISECSYIGGPYIRGLLCSSSTPPK